MVLFLHLEDNPHTAAEGALPIAHDLEPVEGTLNGKRKDLINEPLSISLSVKVLYGRWKDERTLFENKRPPNLRQNHNDGRGLTTANKRCLTNTISAAFSPARNLEEYPDFLTD